ncbi:MAG: PEPxxWA-CTERM sorting domain-containing protein [Sandarakinorhabdus sp.]|nr:PEPxxWA-CTERM sorting domain-containing protein [Sandarakinorhabdus sp.]
MRNKITTLAAAALLSTSANAALPFGVSLESQAPGIQNSTSGFSFVGVERFEGRPGSFTTDFGSGSAFSGVYTGASVIPADQYGGAGGTGEYAVTFSSTGYTLDLSSTVGGVTYFGFWLSALDGGNNVTFYSGGNRLFTFSSSDARDFIQSLPSNSSYYGNPNAPFLNQNSGEPYTFLNFYADTGVTFDKIVFSQSQGGGYESDNHTVGQWTRKSGTFIPNAGAVPEPESWALMIAGFGMVGAVMRGRSKTAVVA